MPRALRLARPIAIAVCLLMLFTAFAARADDATPAADEKAPLYGCGKAKSGASLEVNLKPDLELKDLVTWAMGFSCKKFVYASAIAGRSAKVTVMTPGTMSPAEAWSLYETALHEMGLALVQKGAVLEILESPTAKDEALAILKTFPDGGADVVRLVLRPQHVAADDLRAALDLVRSPHGVVTALTNLHAILITDDAEHVARMKTLVEQLDQPSTGDGVYAIPLEHVDAVAVAQTVQTLLGDAKAPLKLIGDARSNALFFAGTASDYLRVRALAHTVDVDTGDTAQIHLIKLKSQKAKDVLASLTPLAPADVKIAADDASNSLLVLASAREAASLRGLVDEMDVPRKQVYIEAMVLDVDASRDRSLGVAWHGGKKDGSGNTWIGGLTSDTLSTIVPANSINKDTVGAIAGVLGAPIDLTSLLGQSVPSLGLLIKATADTSRIDVLSSPHVMTLDNQKATISVGDTIPYLEATGGTTAAGGTLPSQIQHQKLALSLEITPHVSPADPDDPGAGDVIEMDVSLKSDEQGADSKDLGPTWKERSIDTAVQLHDQESVVLGGLVTEKIDVESHGIPILADLPIIGALFRQSVKNRTKSNLLVILTPHIVDDSAAGREILQRRLRERDEFVEASTDLAHRALDTDVDYRKKRGLLAEIDAEIDEIDREKADLTAAAHTTLPEGRIDGGTTP